MTEGGGVQGIVICWIMAAGLRVLGELALLEAGGVGDWSGDSPMEDTCNES